MSGKVRARNWCLLLYPEDASHANAVKLLDELKYRYVAMLHDKDTWSEAECVDGKHTPGEAKKAHWHIVVKCKQARWNTAIAKQLGIEPNYLQECADFDEAVLYLTHVYQPEKYQYDSSESFGSLTAHLEKLLLDDDEGMRVLEIVKAIDREPNIARYRDILIYCCNNGLYSEFRRLGSGVKYLLDEHNADIYLEIARDEIQGSTLARLRHEREQTAENFGASVANQHGQNFAERLERLERLGFGEKIPRGRELK